MATINSLVNNILQNIFFCVQVIHTDLEQYEDVNDDRILISGSNIPITFSKLLTLRKKRPLNLVFCHVIFIHFTVTSTAFSQGDIFFPFRECP